MIVLDASVWVSLLLTGDVHNQETTIWIANQLEKQQVFEVPSIFAVEVGGAVRRRSGDAEDAKRAINRIHRDPYFHITDLDKPFAAIAAGAAIRFALKGADAIYVALAQRLDIPLVTGDREQRDRVGQFIDVMTPAQAMSRMT